VVPKDTFQFYGDGALKMYCLVALFKLYADVTVKSGRWAMPSLHPKRFQRKKNFLDKKKIE
jgi:hypothetical protein